MEKDDEIKGEGNSINYTYRMHDPRIGRFFAVDPLASSYPHNSPYAFSENRVINSVELEGLEAEEKYNVYRSMEAASKPAVKRSDVQKVYVQTLESGKFLAPAPPKVVLLGVALGADAAFGGWGMRMYGLSALGQNMNATDRYHEAMSNGDAYGAAKAKEEMEATGPAVTGLLIGEATILMAPKILQVVTNTGKYFRNSSIRFSQSSVNGLDDVVASMEKNGWQGDPIDIVKMEDNLYTTVDNTRLLGARKAGIDVKANVHNYDDPISAQMAERFTLKSDGSVPKTWGEAVSNRIQNQNSTFRNNYKQGTFNEPKSGTGGN